MSRLLWAAAGFFGGIAWARNAAAMPAPFAGVVLVVLVVACGLVWFAAYRGKSQAVASAVAVAVAQAHAVSESNAAAVSSSAVHLHLADRDVIAGQLTADQDRQGAVRGTESAQADRALHGAPWAPVDPFVSRESVHVLPE